MRGKVLRALAFVVVAVIILFGSGFYLGGYVQEGRIKITNDKLTVSQLLELLGAGEFETLFYLELCGIFDSSGNLNKKRLDSFYLVNKDILYYWRTRVDENISWWRSTLPFSEEFLREDLIEQSLVVYVLMSRNKDVMCYLTYIDYCGTVREDEVLFEFFLDCVDREENEMRIIRDYGLGGLGGFHESAAETKRRVNRIFNSALKYARKVKKAKKKEQEVEFSKKDELENE